MPCRRLEGERGRVAEHHDVADRRHEPDAPGRLRSDPGALPSSSCGQGSWRRVPRPPVHQRPRRPPSRPERARLPSPAPAPAPAPPRARAEPPASKDCNGRCTSIATAAPSFADASSATSSAIGCKVQVARCRCASRTSGPVVAGLSSAGSTPKAPAMAFLAASSVSTAMLSRSGGVRWSGPRPGTGAPPAMAWDRYSTTSARAAPAAQGAAHLFQRLAAASVQRNDHAAERRIAEDAVQRALRARAGAPPRGRPAAAAPAPSRAPPGRPRAGCAAPRPRAPSRSARRPPRRRSGGRREARRSGCSRSQSRAGTSRSRMRKTASPRNASERASRRHGAPVEQVGARPRPRGRRRPPRGSRRPAPWPSARRARSGRRCRTCALRQARRQRRQRVLRPARGRRHTRLYMQDVVAIAQRQAARLGRGERPFGVVAGE